MTSSQSHGTGKAARAAKSAQVGPTQGDTYGDPQELREDIARTRENLGETVEALAGKADLKGRAKGKATQVKEQAGQAAHTAKDKVTVLTARAQENAASPEARPVVRRAGVAAAASALAVLVWRRRARRNANPWWAAARKAKSQIKTVKGEAKAGARTARKQIKQQAKAQVATAKTKAKTAKAKAKSRH